MALPNRPAAQPAGFHDAEVQRQFSLQAAHFGREGLTLSSAEYLGWVVGQITVHPQDAVLDVAAGTGHLGRALAARAARVVAVDLTWAMITEGLREAARTGVRNLRYVQARAERLPFGSGVFPLVVTRLSLHHFADPRPAVSEMARVCRPHGQVAIMDMVSPDDAGLAESYNRLERLRDPSHTTCLTLAGLRDVATAAGFTVAQVVSRDVVVKADAWMEMTATPPHIREEIRAALMAEINGGRATGMRPFVRDGMLMFTQTWATVVATR